VLRTLKQLAEVYSSMHIGELGRLVPFLPFGDVEAVVVDAVKYDYLQVCVCVCVCARVCVGTCARPRCPAHTCRRPDAATAARRGAPVPAAPPCRPPRRQVRVDHRNGTLAFGAVQLESDKVRGHLALLAKRLAKAAAMWEPGAVPPAVLQQRAAALALCREHVAKEHSRLLARKTVRWRRACPCAAPVPVRSRRVCGLAGS
jgi:hypothetical protein